MSNPILEDAAHLINKGKLKDGLTLIEKALKVNPYNAYGWNLKGRVLEALDDELNAQDCYQKAKEYGFDAILLLSGQDRVPRNPEHVDRKLIEPIGYFSDEESWTQHAISLLSLYKFEEALICYNRALELNPKYTPALENRALLLKLTNWEGHK